MSASDPAPLREVLWLSASASPLISAAAADKMADAAATRKVTMVGRRMVVVKLYSNDAGQRIDVALLTEIESGLCVKGRELHLLCFVLLSFEREMLMHRTYERN
jgi:hypothetical protein